MNAFLKLFALAGLFFLAGTVSAQNEESRDLEDFESVSVSGPFEVSMTAGNSHSIKISISGVATEQLETEVRNGRLQVRMKPNRSFRVLRGKLEITYKKINKFSGSGSGDVTFTNTCKTDKLELSMSGSGKLKGEIETDELEASVSGSGGMSLSGRADKSYIQISGSGGFKCFELKTKETVAQVSGSGGAKVYASEKINAQVSGSGGIRYMGNPDQVISAASGSGKVRPASE